jgi:hypothetical protein
VFENEQWPPIPTPEENGHVQQASAVTLDSLARRFGMKAAANQGRYVFPENRIG